MKSQLAETPGLGKLAVVNAERPLSAVAPATNKRPGTVTPNRVGVVFGLLLGGWHCAWAFLVAVGWAQAVLNFIFWAHFLASPWQVNAFHLGTAAILITVTATLGYVIGNVAGHLWNWIHN